MTSAKEIDEWEARSCRIREDSRPGQHYDYSRGESAFERKSDQHWTEIVERLLKRNIKPYKTINWPVIL